MDRAEAIRLLENGDLHERLRAIRILAANPEPTDQALLKSALGQEKVGWNRRALEAALDKLKVHDTPKLPTVASAGEVDVEEDVIKAIHTKATEEVAGTILHEFAQVLGPLRVWAAKEVPNYANSKTRQNISALNGLMAAIRELKKATATPRFERFVLAELIRDIVGTFDLKDIIVRIAGANDTVVEADPDQLRLVVTNGIRNALEAVSSYSSLKPPEIVLNWGHTGEDTFLVIMDSGPGFSGDPTSALKLGATNKPSPHIGFGLAIAQQAIRTMDGELKVSNADLGTGAVFEIRWFRKNENPIR